MSVPTPPPDWEKLRQSVRGYLGSKLSPDVQRAGGSGLKGNVLGRADDLTQSVMLRLLERAAAGEKFGNWEAVAISEAKFAPHRYWADRREERKELRLAAPLIARSRGKKSGAKVTKLDAVDGHRLAGVRLPNQPSDRPGRLPKSSPRRRGPAIVYLPDGEVIVLRQRKDQKKWKTPSMKGEPLSLAYVVIAYGTDLPMPPWDPRWKAELYVQRADRAKLRYWERAASEMTPREREAMHHGYRARILAPSIREPKGRGR